ncbi:hypothetical protein EYF80_024778 [Liparis tanakae]|uniref:Uncharacterized protein n=1 Tax=Liparis tanakae TaxID=230148 RepID=A0A4Z2HGP1_9TELE|nr:hypothetical protein EYF80_024778 [Liparis tanakae]
MRKALWQRRRHHAALRKTPSGCTEPNNAPPQTPDEFYSCGKRRGAFPGAIALHQGADPSALLSAESIEEQQRRPSGQRGRPHSRAAEVVEIVSGLLRAATTPFSHAKRNGSIHINGPSSKRYSVEARLNRPRGRGAVVHQESSSLPF